MSTLAEVAHNDSSVSGHFLYFTKKESSLRKLVAIICLCYLLSNDPPSADVAYNDLSATTHFLYLTNKENSSRNFVAINLSVISTDVTEVDKAY